MDDKDISKTQKDTSLNESMNSSLKEELLKILEELKIKGEIKDKNYPLVTFLKEKGSKLKKSRIKYSYTNAQTLWREFKADDKIYLFRITGKINNNVRELIKNEFKIHQECEDITYITTEFVCYYFSDFLNFSVFITNDYYTLEEILTKKNLPNFSDDENIIKFSIDELFSSALETIKNLKLNEQYYICPYITPSDLLFTESAGKQFFLFSEIFLKVNSIEKEIEIELNNKNVKEWLSPEFIKNKAKLSFSSNIACLGNLFFRIAFNQNPKKPINIKENSIFKELIDNCMEIDIKKRWNLDKIGEYLDENNFEEKLEEMRRKEKIENDNLKNELIELMDKDNNLDNYIINKPEIENQANNIGEEINDKNNKEITNKNNIIIGQTEEKYEIKINDDSEHDKIKEKEEKERKSLFEKENKEIFKENLEKYKNEIELNKKLIEMKNEEIKKNEEIYRKQKEQENQKKLEEDNKIKEEEKKRKEEEEKLEKVRKEKERLDYIELEKMENELKKLNEDVERNKMEEQKRKKEEEEEREKKEKERMEIEKMEKERQEKEKMEKEKKEKEYKEQEKRRQEMMEKKKKEIIRLKMEREKQEKEKKEEEERKKREEEKKKKEQEHTKNYPDGISSINENMANKEINFIHLEINFKKELEEIEIFDIFGPSKKGFKFINIENNKYYVVFPFYKFNKLKKIIFGIRDINNKELIDDNEIDGEYLKFNSGNQQWELNILKKEYSEMVFDIFNVPKEINKIFYLKFLNKLHLKNYKFSLDCIRKVTSILKNQEVLDLIMEIGINDLYEELIKILIDRKIDIYSISHYLEKHKNNKFKNNYYDIAPNIIFSLNSKNTTKEEKSKINDKEENNYGQRKCLLFLDQNIPKDLYPNNYQKNLFDNTIKNLGKSIFDDNKFLEKKRKDISKKLSEFNENQKSHGLKEITCILTDTTVKKISQLEFGIMANIPIIIQGFTSAGKSFLSLVASKINKRECLSTALSEHTTIEDLLGRDVIKSDSSITFIPGILLLAYKDGKTLILDECDLAKPEILSCILGSMTKNELIICNKTFRKMDGYNVILTMNGEVKGFNEKQRNILTSNILSKFVLIPFDEMEKEECKEIFISLLKKSESPKEYTDNINAFIEIHQKMIEGMKNKEEIKNVKSIDPLVTLRNLKYCCYLSMNNIHPKTAAEISYIARFPKNERKNYDFLLDKFGNFKEDITLKTNIEEAIKNEFLFYNETYKKGIYLALTAIKEGLHPLLIGEKGSGLTTLAKLVASISGNNNYEFLLCSSETSVEDLMGCYQPQIKIKDKTQDLSSYIKWCDGPVPIAGKKGIPIILDNINYSKPQVIECLNPLLEQNSKYNNVEYTILEKENEGPIKMNKGFSIIGTMNIDKENKNSISKALMNRFVAIYIDNDLEINDEDLKKIIENTGKKIDKQIHEINLIIDKNKKEEIFENFNDNESSNESDKNDDDSSSNIIYNNENKIEIQNIPDWYDIKSISEKTITEIQKYIKKDNTKLKNLKKLIKRITKLSLVYERINKFGFTMKDCDEFIDLKFNNNNEIYKNLQKSILSESKETKNRYFFDDFLSDSWKMIMSIISSNISNTAIFLQGVPGSGKSCAARHYGTYRIFQNRNPILSINCHRDLKFDYLVGNYNFKDSKFDFIDGPLITAMKKGECILLDEFNLCSENILINLLPLFKSNINDEIRLKGVPEPIHIAPGFQLIATGNTPKEKGRNVISSMIYDEINTLEINSINLMRDVSLIKNILQNEYREIFQEDNSYQKDKISAEQIKQLNEVLKQDIQFKLSLRQIKCLLERIMRFCTEENYDFGGFTKIPVIYIIISYIIPQLKIGRQKLKEFLEKLDNIMKYNNLGELMEFIVSKVEFETTFIENRDIKEEKRFIKKGNIYLLTNMPEKTFPQVTLQAYFWIRMSCSLKSESPSIENILLAGTSSYKEYLLNTWLGIKLITDKSIDSLFLTKNTETDNLIGISSLDDENKLDIKINNLIDNAIFYFDLPSTKIPVDNYEEKFQLIKKNKKIVNCLCLNYLYENIKKLKYLKNSFNNVNNEQIGLKTVTSFNLGIVPKAYIFGKKLILKGIENPESSVIERLNPILENPRHLIITEDNQEIYNDDKIFKKIYKENIKSVPLNDSFRIFFTSREVFQVKLSKAFISRLTIINCPNYDNENYLSMKLNPEENYKLICKSIVENDDLVQEIFNFNKILKKIENIEFLRFIRWCKSTKNICNRLEKIQYDADLFKKYGTELFHKNTLNYKYIIGISALRSIIDRYESKYREYIISTYLKDYLPDKLFKLLSSKFNNELESCPIDLIEHKGKKYIFSKVSGIFLEFPDDENPNATSLQNIQWTKSSVDICDAIIIALVSNAILILEGPPGRGKTAISRALYNYLRIEGDNLKRINFTPSIIIEDVFARTIPKINGDKVSTERKQQSLLFILEKSQNSRKFYKYGLILDEFNLASDILLEYLYSYLDCILNKKDYISPDGVKYQNIGNVGVIVTMNDA